jgi:hypothetical protein
MPPWKNELEHLKPHYQKLKGQIPKLTKELDRLFNTSEEVAVFTYVRRALEIMATEICEKELKRDRGKESLEGILDKFNREKAVPENIVSSMKNLNRLGSCGAHPKPYSDNQIREALVSLLSVLEWYVQYEVSNNTIVENLVEETRENVEPIKYHPEKASSKAQIFFPKLWTKTIIALLFLLVMGGSIYYVWKHTSLEERATVLVHDLEKDIKISRSLYIHPLTLFVLHEQKSHLDIFDSALRDVLSQSEWLVPLNPKEKLSSADLFFLREQAKCGAIYCMSLIANLIQADNELEGEVRINKEKVNVRIWLTNNNLINRRTIANATIDFPKSLLTQEMLEQLKSLKNAEAFSKGNLQIEMSTSHGVDNVTYHHGESLRLFIRTNQAAYIYVFVFDAQNHSTLLYPESKYDEPKIQDADKLFILPEDGLPHYSSLPVEEPFGARTLWAVAVTTPLEFPEEMDDTWFKADILRQQVRKLGLANSDSDEFVTDYAMGYAEVEIVVETIGPADKENTDKENDDELDSFLD